MSKVAIVGGGISGLSLAHFLQNKIDAANITLFEAQAFGGAVSSQKEGDLVLEHGPETYQARNQLLHKIAADLNLTDQLVKADSAAAKRFLVKDGRIVKFPTGPMSFLFNSILFFPAKIKVFLALRKSYSLWKGISLFDACKHVFGQQFAEYFASSLGRGVWGTEAEDLEFAAAFPDLFEAIVENEKSTTKLSLMKLVKKLGAEKAAYWQNELGTIDPKFEKGLYTFKGGLQTLTDALREELKSSAAKIESVKVSRISSQNKEYYLQTKSQKYGPFNKVIFTCNPTELGALFKDYKKDKPETRPQGRSQGRGSLILCCQKVHRGKAEGLFDS